MGLTSAPANIWPLAWIAQAPLWFIIYCHSIKDRSVQKERYKADGRQQKGRGAEGQGRRGRRGRRGRPIQNPTSKPPTAATRSLSSAMPDKAIAPRAINQPTPNPSQEGEPTPSLSQEGEPTPSLSQEGEPTPSLSQEGEPTPSPSQEGEPTPSPSQEGEPTPSPSQEGEPTPSPSQEGEPTPSPFQEGEQSIQTPQRSNFPTPQLPNSSTPQRSLQHPTSNIQHKPTPSPSWEGEPTPSPSWEGEPTPSPSQKGNRMIQHPTSNIQHLTFPLLAAVLWGVGYYGTTLIWITGLHPLTWMGIPWLVSGAIALACWCIITLWGCVWCLTWTISLFWISRRFFPSASLNHGLSRVFIGTALWCGFDTLWSQGILYWPTFAFTQSPHNLWILQLNQLSGPITTTAIIAAVNGLLAEAWMVQRQFSSSQSPTPKFFPLVQPYFVTAIILSAIAHTLGAFLYIQRSPAATSSTLSASPDSITMGLIQGNIPTAVKLTDNGIRQAFNRYTESYLKLAAQGVDMALMPEGALPVLWRYPDYPPNPMVRAVEKQRVPVILGTFIPQKLADNTFFANTITQSLLMVIGGGSNTDVADVEVVSQYDKVKLVPLGEYIPASGILGSIITRLSPIQSSMVPGTTDQRFTTPFGQAIVGICYESAFPQLFRRQTALGGEFIITASNNDPYNEAMMAQHHAQDVMRAIESDRWAVRVTNTGYSGVVNHRGQTVWRSHRNTYETHLATIHRRHTQTLYTRWGNWITPTLLSLAIGLIGYSFATHHRPLTNPSEIKKSTVRSIRNINQSS